MTQRRSLEAQLRLFGELMDLMSAMKNLAITELHKLQRFMGTQERVVGTTEAIITDFIGHYPLPAQPAPAARPWIVLVGSERGFCGGFNDAVLAGLDAHLAREPGAEPRLVAVGRRLCRKLEGDPRLVAEVEGAAVVDEVDAVLQRTIAALEGLSGPDEPFFLLSLTVLHHGPESDEGPGHIAALRPIAPFLNATPLPGVPPMLHLPPEQFLGELIDQYFLAALHAVVYRSLMAENHWRLRQTDGALHRMERRMQDWQKRLNRMRQEEITEEIEQIMLSVEALQHAQGPGADLHTPGP